MKYSEQYLQMQKLAGIITEGEYKTKISENSLGPTPQKREILLNKISSKIPGREKEFLIFMMEADGGDFTSPDMNIYSMDDLLNSFISFEEDNNEEELTPEIMDEVLQIYIPGFERGELEF
jgi:hypothetical protein|tara:strand:+ start:757 stop:1119 length:363 start_codon:yes stop_codon:yes gene_type:complete